MGDQYGTSIREIGHRLDIDMNVDIGYGISIWDTVYRYGYLLYRYGHPGYRYGIRANDMGDDSINMVILHIDMGYLVTLSIRPCLVLRLQPAGRRRGCRRRRRLGLRLVWRFVLRFLRLLRRKGVAVMRQDFAAQLDVAAQVYMENNV
jgi:hypothetical protein